MPLYVETWIRATIDDVWSHTQTPELHERWDLRFTTITYLPKGGDDEAQRFRYATRIGLGIEIEGWGETVGRRDAENGRTSALKFGSNDRRSLIAEGTGYWRYESRDGGTRFLTGYDYQVRGGAIGRLVDRFAFRPLIGWATAWSFDRLRLWIEDGVDPAASARRALIHAVATINVAFVWAWHGLVPKLLGPHPGELALLTDAGVPEELAHTLTIAAGYAELIFAVLFIRYAHRRLPWIITIVLMLAATIGVAFSAPERCMEAFGPVTINLQMVAVSIIGLLCLRHLPSARRCLRKAPAA